MYLCTKRFLPSSFPFSSSPQPISCLRVTLSSPTNFTSSFTTPIKLLLLLLRSGLLPATSNLSETPLSQNSFSCMHACIYSSNIQLAHDLLIRRKY